MSQVLSSATCRNCQLSALLMASELLHIGSISITKKENKNRGRILDYVLKNQSVHYLAFVNFAQKQERDKCRNKCLG